MHILIKILVKEDTALPKEVFEATVQVFLSPATSLYKVAVKRPCYLFGPPLQNILLTQVPQRPPWPHFGNILLGLLCTKTLPEAQRTHAFYHELEFRLTFIVQTKPTFDYFGQ